MVMASCFSWPPRSPHEALLSSPSGRNKLRQHHDRSSPSPSPSKKSSARLNLHHALIDDDDEDDEETLQLRLEALEARLKLKKLQQKKLRTQNKCPETDHGHRGQPVARPRPNEATRPRRHSPIKDQVPSTGHKSLGDVQVLVSPQKRIVVAEARSPGRVLLGIDKGLRGRNVSLRRPPRAQTNDTKDEDPFRDNHWRDNPGATNVAHASSLRQQDEAYKPKSFSQRIAETRQQDKEQRERSNRLQKQRSTGFGIQQQDLDAFKHIANTLPESKERISSRNTGTNGEFSRDEVLRAVGQPAGRSFRNNTTSGAINTRNKGCWDTDGSTSLKPHPKSLTSATDRVEARLTTNPHPASASIPKAHASSPPPTIDDPLFEEFSSIYLSKRLIPQSFLSQTFGQKHVSLLPSLLAAIKSPSYILPPDLESDFVVLGIIASKSSPLSHKDAYKSTSASDTSSLAEATDSNMNARGKYMVFTLTDLKWSLDLYLFTTAYTRFWKLTPGTLIAILNPSIMPPPPGKADTGRFSLVLNSSDDTILEIGTARDLSWCKSVRKDGKQCESWVDKRHTQFCEWHVDRGVESMRKGRMEVNGMSAPYAPGGKKGGRTGFWGGRRKNDEKREGLAREGPQWDRGTGSRYFVGPSLTGAGRSAASLLDAEGGAEERGGSREERVRKRLAERERERDIARQLGEGGNGIGSEYLRLQGDALRDNKGVGNHGEKAGPGEETATLDAKGLGLLGNKASDVLLSPVKRKRNPSLGEGEKAERKRTRFVTASGIKLAGRESLGVAELDPACGGGDTERGRDGDGVGDGDEEELDIV